VELRGVGREGENKSFWKWMMKFCWSSASQAEKFTEFVFSLVEV
jgi:hypothetical protein